MNTTTNLMAHLIFKGGDSASVQSFLSNRLDDGQFQDAATIVDIAVHSAELTGWDREYAMWVAQEQEDASGGEGNSITRGYESGGNFA